MATVGRMVRFAARLAERSGGGWLVVGADGTVRDVGGRLGSEVGAGEAEATGWERLIAGRDRETALEWLRMIRRGAEEGLPVGLADCPGEVLEATATVLEPGGDVLVAFTRGDADATMREQDFDGAYCEEPSSSGGPQLSTQHLQSHLNLLETLLEAIPNPVFYKDAGGVYQGCNTSFSESIIGQPKDWIIGKRISELDASIPPELGRLYNEKDLELIRSGGVQTYDAEARCADGSMREFTLCKAVFRNDAGELGGIVGVMWDISDRKRRQREVEGLLREKNELLREVHHRVKNNLQIIASLLSLQMARSRENAEFQRQAREAQGRVYSMALVHDELYGSGNFAEIDLFSYSQRLLSRHAASTPDVRIVGIVEGGHAPLALEKAIPCGLLLNELIHNATVHAFSGRSEGRITIAIAEEGDWLRVEVRDDGVGMSPELLCDEPSTLGMQIVRSLTDQLCGSLELLQGKGTTLVLRFPY